MGTAFPELAQFLATGLNDLSEEREASLRLLLKRLHGEETPFLPKMRICSVADSTGETFFVLLEEPRYLAIPGTYNVGAHVFGASWELLSQVSFSAGWRMDVTDVEVADHSPLGRSVLCFRTAPFINGLDVGREYYALCSGRLVLVRLEDAQGVAIENVYGAPNHTIGPVPAELGELAGAITEDADAGLLLEALTFMGGRHLTLEKLANRNVLSETEDLIRCVDELFSSTAVRDRVATLVESDNVWIRDAARLAQSRQVYD
ncbi:MAG: hypothetical protein ICCCNLDF_02878 [Planctomycetes bacterium]|nr:hypothetical protein [Planctomycetota bacterium]